MPSQSVTLNFDGERYPGRLNEPDEPTESGVLVLPGMSHGPFGDVFDRFGTAAAERGHRVARFETWTDRDDVAEKSGSEHEREIQAGVEFLRDRECETVTIVAKSFGGRLALEHLANGVDRLVLWAPAILFGEHEDAPSVTARELSTVMIPVRILQGDEDEVVSVENARSIAEHLPNGELVELPGEDHSFRTDEDRIVDETLSFLP